MEEIMLNKNDELVMRLLHYFITEEGYSPIILHGIQNEIWLENLSNDYKIIRIVSNYIHNDEQLEFDLFRTKQIIRKIKSKTFSFQASAISIFINFGENVHFNQYQDIYPSILLTGIQNIEDLKQYEQIERNFPHIFEETDFKEKGLELFVKITEDLNKKNKEETDKMEDVFKMKKPIITQILIGINLFIFLLSMVIGSSTMIQYGANIRILIQNHEFYRLLTSAFIHVDFLHLLCNMYSLYIIGPQLESFLGKTKYLTIYLFSAITGNLMSMLFTNASIGASGAIFGLFGSMLYFGYHYRVYLGNIMKSQLIPLITINLIFGFLATNVDNAAHIGGLIGGSLMTIALGVKYRSTNFEKINGWIVSILYIMFLTYMAFRGI